MLAVRMAASTSGIFALGTTFCVLTEQSGCVPRLTRTEEVTVRIGQVNSWTP